MALVEGRRRTVGVRVVAVLWDERGLQVRGIIDRVRPGIGCQEFVVAVEALTEIGGQPVVDRAAIGVVGVMSLKGTQLASPVESGLHAVFCPAACRSESARGARGANTPASEGLMPDGREKLVSAAGTKYGSGDRGRVRSHNWNIQRPGQRCGCPRLPRLASSPSANYTRGVCIDRSIRCRPPLKL